MLALANNERPLQQSCDTTGFQHDLGPAPLRSNVESANEPESPETNLNDNEPTIQDDDHDDTEDAVSLVSDCRRRSVMTVALLSDDESSAFSADYEALPWRNQLPDSATNTTNLQEASRLQFETESGSDDDAFDAFRDQELLDLEQRIHRLARSSPELDDPLLLTQPSPLQPKIWLRPTFQPFHIVLPQLCLKPDERPTRKRQRRSPRF